MILSSTNKYQQHIKSLLDNRTAKQKLSNEVPYTPERDLLVACSRCDLISKTIQLINVEQIYNAQRWWLIGEAIGLDMKSLHSPAVLNHVTQEWPYMRSLEDNHDGRK